MFKKPALMAAFGIGYVLGARAGRERYDAIAGKAQELWHDPRVQQKAHRARFVANEKAESARRTVQDKMHADTGPRPGTGTDPVTGIQRGWES